MNEVSKTHLFGSQKGGLRLAIRTEELIAGIHVRKILR